MVKILINFSTFGKLYDVAYQTGYNRILVDAQSLKDPDSSITSDQVSTCYIEKETSKMFKVS